MSRVEKYRHIRRIRRKCMFVLFVSFFIMVSGIIIVDQSVNSLMNKEEGLAMVSVKSYREDYYYVKVFDKDFFLNAKYIKNDINKFKEWLSHKF